jgi:ApaG protein
MIKVEVQPSYVREQSDPAQSYYYFSYKVRISNQGESPVQLVRRHWVIKDAFGQMEEVTGEGVVGMQPTLKPGDVFEYSSFCPLSTPTGSMQGKYYMRGPKGEEIEVEIPLFILSEPNHYH